jgi:hypothetical protein
LKNKDILDFVKRSKSMADKVTKKVTRNKKRPAKGMRAYIRRLKQEARKEGTVYRAPLVRHVPEKTAEE